MDFKSIEVYYDVAAIPGIKPWDKRSALAFRNAAMDHIEAALDAEGVGEWAGAESGIGFATGAPDVNFGFEVSDFDRAERIVRAAVTGTPYDCIREITRFDETAFA